MELPVDPVEWTRCCLVSDRRSQGLAANNALQAERFHQPLDAAPGWSKTFTAQLPPYLAGAIDLKILRKDALYFRDELNRPGFPGCRLV